MADHTRIEWTDATWNPVTGCSVISPGCTNCYAMKLAGTRLRDHPSRRGLTTPSKAGPVWNGQVRFNAEWLGQPLGWKKPRRIFVCAHGDLFHEAVPFGWVDMVFAVMALAPQHTFQVLTKRSARMKDYMLDRSQARADGRGTALTDLGYRGPFEVFDWPLPNVWLGVSAENQPRWDERVADLAETPAALRWVSVEPMLGRIIPGPLLNCLRWAVLGGESGQHARPMHPDWPREFLKACDTTDVAFFFKQWGEWLGQLEQQVTHSGGALAWVRARDGRLASTEDVDCIELREGHQDDWKIIRKVGKKAAGRLLDGVEHNAMPEPRA